MFWSRYKSWSLQLINHFQQHHYINLQCLVDSHLEVCPSFHLISYMQFSAQEIHIGPLNTKRTEKFFALDILQVFILSILKHVLNFFNLRVFLSILEL